MKPRRLSDQKLADLLATARINPDGALLVNPRALIALVSECQAGRLHFKSRGELCRELEGSTVTFLNLKTKKRGMAPRSTRRAS